MEAAESVAELLDEAMGHLAGMSGVDQLEQAIVYAGSMSTAYRWLLEQLPVQSGWRWEDTSGAGGALDRRVVVDTDGLAGPNSRGELTLHPFEEGHRYWTKLHGQLLRDAATLGIEDRKTRIREEHVARIGEAIRGVVQGLGRELDDPEVVPVVEQSLRLIAGDQP